MLCCIGCSSFAACGRTHCPGFPEHLSDYNIYKTGDTLSFVNQHNDVLSFRVWSTSFTKKSSYGMFCGCECSDPQSLSSATTLSLAFSLLWTINAGIYGSKPCIHFRLDGYSWNSGAFSKASFLYLYDETGKDPFDPKNSALFGDTIIIEDNSQLINRVIAVKGKGITGFHDQVNDFQWKSINKNNQ